MLTRFFLYVIHFSDCQTSSNIQSKSLIARENFRLSTEILPDVKKKTSLPETCIGISQYYPNDRSHPTKFLQTWFVWLLTSSTSVFCRENFIRHLHSFTYLASCTGPNTIKFVEVSFCIPNVHQYRLGCCKKRNYKPALEQENLQQGTKQCNSVHVVFQLHSD